MAQEVAQVSNLLCRRLSAFAAHQSAASARRLPVGRASDFAAPADWKSAIRQTGSTGSLRYGAPSAEMRVRFGDGRSSHEHCHSPSLTDYISPSFPNGRPGLKLPSMGFGKSSASRTRLAVVVITAAALWVVLHRLNLEALAAAFRTMHWAWFSAAVALYGLAFLPATWRWHLILRLTGTAVHPGATGRLTLIGHFFYNILFGAVGGDTAKAALYARWYRWPLPIVLASIPIDRLLGLAGLIVLGSLSLAFKANAEIFSGAKFRSLKWPGLWIVVLLVVGFLFVVLMKKLRPGSAWRSFRKTFFSAGRLLLSSPRVAFAGVTTGFLVQVLLNGALALNLQ